MTNPFIPRSHPDDHPDLAKDRTLLRRAPRMSWRVVKAFADGALPRPASDAPAFMRLGWMLYVRGYETPPLWLRHEWLERARRSWGD